MDKKNAIAADLIACKTAFDQAGIPWAITDGVVLGYARYKNIMSWDTDLDTGVFVEMTNDEWQRLYNALRMNGFIFPNERNDFICCNREAAFGMGMFHKKGDYYEAFPASTPGLKFIEKASWHDEHQIVDFLGDKYPMPNNMDDYLVCRYGNDWKTNIVKDAEQFFIERRGGHNQSTWTIGRSSKHGDLWPKILKIEDNIEEVL